MAHMIVITGANRGVGKYLYDEFYDHQPNVSPLTRKESDITDPEQLKDYFNLYPRGTKITLIHCAGINYNSFAHKSDPDKWKNVVDTNLTGSFNVAAAALPIMREVGWGRIIFMSSVVGKQPGMGVSAYAASKSGLYGLAKALAVENATKGITVNCLNLGYFNIGMISEVPEAMQEKIKEKIPMSKFGDPSNIKDAIEFLIKSDYTTGSIIDINGGL